MKKIWLIILIILFSILWMGGFLELLSTILLCIIVTAYFSLEERISKLESLLTKPVSLDHPVIKLPESAVSPSDQFNINITKKDKNESLEIEPQKLQSIIKKPETKTENWLLSWIKSYLFTGNPIAKIGVLILFIGVAFLLKYAAGYIHFSIERRLIIVSLAGIAMVLLGCRLHTKRPVFANILQGGGTGLVYLAIYAAFRVYAILPPFPAFILLFITVILTGTLALFYNAKSLAVLGILGGFISPILISTGEGNFVLLFSYYTLLNFAILSIAWVKSWNELNLLGFVFTFFISALWGWQAYQLHYFYITQFFLILFFLFYNAIAILYAISQPHERKGYVNATITFGTPFITYALEIGLVRHFDRGLAWAAFAFCLFYAAIAFTIYLCKRSHLRILMESYIAIALLFGTIAIPLASSANWSVLAWAIEGLMILYIGIQQQRLLLRIAGGILQLCSGFLFLINNIHIVDILRPYYDSFYLTGAIVGLAGLACGSLWYKFSNRNYEFEEDFSHYILIWGSLWWYGFGVLDIYYHVNQDYFLIGSTLFFAVSSAVFWLANELLTWNRLRYPALALFPIMLMLAIVSAVTPLASTRFLLETWLISFVVSYVILYRHDKFPAPYLPALHLLSLWLLTWVLADQADRGIAYFTNLSITWRFVLWGGTASLVLLILQSGNRLLAWPLNKYKELYEQTGGALIYAFLLMWFVISHIFSGNCAPLPYIPFFNPLDFTIGCMLVISTFWLLKNDVWLTNYIQSYSKKSTLILFSIFMFTWLNAVLLRTLHHWLTIPYTLDNLWNSTTVQACISIFWTLLALIAAFIATRIRSRELWFISATLIVVVLIKLFFVDLSGVGTLQRVITFISVGILLLINGYISLLLNCSRNEILHKNL